MKVGINQEKYLRRLVVAYGNESSSHATVFKLFSEYTKVPSFPGLTDHVSCSPKICVGHTKDFFGEYER